MSETDLIRSGKTKENNENHNELIDEYMNLIRCSSPYCNCGKCITRKYKSNIYNNSIEEKVNRVKNSENKIRMNKINVIINQNNKDYQKSNRNQIQNPIPPFIGRSSYELMFPNYQIPKRELEIKERKILNNIPFNGNSSYKENFSRFEKRYYINRVQPFLKSDNLETKGEILKESISRENYRPINMLNYRKVHNLDVVQVKRPSSIIPAPYSKDSFLSSYEKAFMLNNLTAKKDINNHNSSMII
jgi:hypothetical protein